MKNCLLFLTIILQTTFLFGQINIPSKNSGTTCLKVIKSEPTSWTMDWAQFPNPETTLVDLNEDHRYRISYSNSTRKDVSHIVVVCLSMKRPEPSRTILSKGQSIDIEGYRIIVEHYLYPPGNTIRCIEGCKTWKDCNCAYIGTILALD